MEDLSLHILDIAENSIAAGARTISISVLENTLENLLRIDIADDGRGMDPAMAEKAADPFSTSRTTRRVGLGLALLREAAEAANGSLAIRSKPGRGTTVTATFELHHIDRKPLGQMTETIIALIVSRGDLDIVYRHTRDDRSVVFDTRTLRGQLREAPLNSAGAMSALREHLMHEEESLAH